MGEVVAGLMGEVGGCPFGAVLTLVLAFPFGAVLMLTLGFLMLTLGFAVRTEATFANSGLLPLRLALALVVERRLDLVLLGFLTISTPRRGAGCKSCPQKGSDAEARTALPWLSREEGGKTALMLGRVNRIGGRFGVAC